MRNGVAEGREGGRVSKVSKEFRGFKESKVNYLPVRG